jgi:large subunit ribosomal protein L18
MQTKRKKRVVGTKYRPRLVVYRSLKYIYGQIVDDMDKKVLLSISNKSKNAPANVTKAKNKVEASHEIGKSFGEQAVKHKIEKVIFDRNGYLFHGRIRAFIEGVREGGLKF